MQLVFTYSCNSYIVSIDLKFIVLTICHFFSEVRYKQRLKSMDERGKYMKQSSWRAVRDSGDYELKTWSVRSTDKRGRGETENLTGGTMDY